MDDSCKIIKSSLYEGGSYYDRRKQYDVVYADP